MTRVELAATPLVVAADQTTTVTLHPRPGQEPWRDDQTYLIRHLPMDTGGGVSAESWPTQEVRGANGCLAVTCQFPGEQEQVLRVERRPEPGKDPVLAIYRVYSVRPDLLARRPFKGDVHIHSNCSDGREPPACVAASCRRIGLDFMALTDHRQYAPSLVARDTLAAVPHDLAIFPGEEVHPPRNAVHIVNFGGEGSVNAEFDQPAYAREVAELQQGLGPLPAGVDPYMAASCRWTFGRIRALNGLAIFAHPFWVAGQRCDVPVALTEWLMANRPFDAFELLGGYHLFEFESNYLTLSYYAEGQARFGTLSVVGASDAHGCDRGELFGWYYTLVFAAGPSRQEIIAAIRGGWSLAVEVLPNGPVRLYGPYRLVKLAYFLFRQYFPRHDEYCAEEGRWLLAHLAGDPQAAAILGLLKGRTPRLQALAYAAPA